MRETILQGTSAGISDAGEVVHSDAEIFEGTLRAGDLTDHCRLIPDADALRILCREKDLRIGYAEVISVSLSDETVRIATFREEYYISQMGRSCEWFFQNLSEAYRDMTASILLTEGVPLMRCVAMLSETETFLRDALSTNSPTDVVTVEGEIEVRVYGDAILLLPTNDRARRLPFLFLDSVQTEEYGIHLFYRSGEKVWLSMMGRNLEPFVFRIKSCADTLRENHRLSVSRLLDAFGKPLNEPGSDLPREGIAMNFQKIRSGYPDLAECLMNVIGNSRMAETFPILSAIGEAGEACVGFRELSEKDGNISYAIWAVIPTKGGQAAIVEFAFPDENTATYIFRLRTDFADFLLMMNRAFEATGFTRELLTKDDDSLCTEESTDARMLLVRTPAVRALRHLFYARVIHSGIEHWRKVVLDTVEKIAESAKTERTEILKQENSPAIAKCDEPSATVCRVCHNQTESGLRFCRVCGASLREEPVSKLKFCRSCGTAIQPGKKYCVSCGQKIQ